MNTYWHAGPNGIGLGEMIIPAAQLPELPIAYLSPDYDTNPNRVYVTTDRPLAMAYASQWNIPGGGSLYRVQPIGELTEDPDYAEANISWTADAAEVLEVAAFDVSVGIHAHVRATGRFQTWETATGTHVMMYDDRGHMNPSPEMLAAGFDTDTLKSLGRWIPLEIVDAVLSHCQATGSTPTRALVERALAER